MIDAVTSMGLSTALGFVMKLIANWQADKAEYNKTLLNRHKAHDESMDKANDRGNVWMRRFVVFAMIGLFVFVSAGISEPTNIVREVEGDSYLWGLIQFRPETIITQVNGTIRDDSLLMNVYLIITFLFGVDVAQRK